MISTLIFLLGADADAPIVWGRVADGRIDAHGTLVDASGLATLVDEAAQVSSIAAVLQGEDVASRTIPAPPKGERRLQEAARLLMEDELAEPADGLHIAAALSSAGARIAAVRSDIIERWVGAFRAAGLELDALVVDYLALPSASDGGALILRDGRAVAAFDGGGFAAETALVCGELWQEFFGPERRYTVLADAAQQRLLPFRARTESAGAADDHNLLLLYARAANDSERLDLLQGRFRRRTPWRAIAAPWRRAAMLAACAGAAALLAILSDGAKQARTAEKWRTAAETVHARAFPGVPVDRAVANARSRLAQGSTRTFSRVTSVVGKAAQGFDAVEIARIRYDSAGAAYFISVRSMTDADIEAFKNRLNAGGVSAADNGGYRRIGDIWAGELAVRAQ
jgi:type II secretion system protein L